MSTKEIARGGILAAASVAFLYAGSVLPYLTIFTSVIAGIISTVPMLSRGRIRKAVLVYIVVSILSILLLPRKGIACSYIAFMGLYPIMKYAIECKAPLKARKPIKLVYFNIALAAGFFAIKYLMMQNIVIGSFRMGTGWISGAIMWLAANAIFLAYDIGLSSLIATIQRRLPPE